MSIHSATIRNYDDTEWRDLWPTSEIMAVAASQFQVIGIWMLGNLFALNSRLQSTWRLCANLSAIFPRKSAGKLGRENCKLLLPAQRTPSGFWIWKRSIRKSCLNFRRLFHPASLKSTGGKIHPWCCAFAIKEAGWKSPFLRDLVLLAQKLQPGAKCSHLGRSAHLTSLFYKLYWLPVFFQVHFKIWIMTYKALYTMWRVIWWTASSQLHLARVACLLRSVIWPGPEILSEDIYPGSDLAGFSESSGFSCGAEAFSDYAKGGKWCLYRCCICCIVLI